MTIKDLLATLPLVITVVWATLLLVVDLFLPAGRKGVTALLAALGLALAAGFAIAQAGGERMAAYAGLAVVDGLSAFLCALFALSGLAAVGLAYDYLKRMQIERGEYYPLLMYSTAGMMLMSMANDLMIVFLALEFLSIPLYVLAGFAHPRKESEESALKYFLLGTFASGFVLYGISLVFASTAHTDLPGVLQAAQGMTAPFNHTLLLVGAGLLLAGFAFKLAAAPFHQWAPDVYQGAPTPVTAFMSVGAKAAGAAALLRVFLMAFPSLAGDLSPVIWGLAALTMLVGNLTALAQKNIKRLLGYSSIAQGGYLLMAFLPYAAKDMAGESASAMIFFLAGYALASVAAWAVVVALEGQEGAGLEIDNYAGLGRNRPLLALVMSLAMLSYTGMPLTAGFWGKLYLFRTAAAGGYVSLALLGLVTSVISAFYYLRVIVVMYMRSPQNLAEKRVFANFWVSIVAGIAALAVFVVGVFPGPLLDFAVEAIKRF